MIHVIKRVSTEAMNWKINQGSITFGANYLYHTTSILMLPLTISGLLILLGKNTKFLTEPLRTKVDSIWRIKVFVLVGLGIYIYSSSKFFSAARTIVNFLPIFYLLASIALYQAFSHIEKKYSVKFSIAASTLTSIVILLLQAPAMLNTWKSTHSIYNINTWTKKQKVNQLITVNNSQEHFISAQLIRIKTDDICKLSNKEKYFYSYRAVPITKNPNPKYNTFLNTLRKIEPFISFPQYNAADLYLFEFPLKPEVFNHADKLTTHRNIYLLQDVKAAYCTQKTTD